MINTTELNTHDNHTHDNILKTVDLREDTTNTLELLAERPQVQIERFVKDNIKLSKKIISQIKMKCEFFPINVFSNSLAIMMFL